jgi:hypothetical protein
MGNRIEGARATALLVTEQFPVACLMCCILSDPGASPRGDHQLGIGTRKTGQDGNILGLKRVESRN